ncbi:MAG: hypothetical protein U0235_17220 [Polyangiaceae bacterium]
MMRSSELASAMAREIETGCVPNVTAITTMATRMAAAAIGARDAA